MLKELVFVCGIVFEDKIVTTNDNIGAIRC